MRVGFLLIVALIALSLPCVELPECAGMYDDTSNDFIVASAGVQQPVCAPNVQASRFADVHLNRLAVFTIFRSLFSSALISRGAPSVLDLVFVQKK